MSGLSIVTLGFYVVFAVFFAVYWLIRGNSAQKWLLLAASYAFYAAIDWRFCLILLAVSVVAYDVGRRLGKAELARTRKALLIAGVMFSVLVLVVFRHFGFFWPEAARLLEDVGFSADSVTMKLLLPVGVSFYVFKVISYLIDVYRDKTLACFKPLDLLVYVAFFPQLLSGPIDRATTFLPQLGRERHFDKDSAVQGTRQILWGLFKKLVLADGLATFVGPIMGDYTHLRGPELALGAILFSAQIYCDFSGYTDISIGLTKLLGIQPMRNFAYPYFSQNVAEFWRRWNISVSSWFRDYVYIPLGGSRVTRRRFVINIFITFLLSGLWHGTGLTFLAWGAMLGLGVTLTSVRRRPVLKATDTPGGERLTPAAAAKIVVTFAYITLAWVFFRADSLEQALGIITRILTPSFRVHDWLAPLHTLVQMDALAVVLVVFVAVEWLQRRRESTLDLSLPRVVRWLSYTTVFWVTVLLYQPSLSGMFIYFRF